MRPDLWFDIYPHDAPKTGARLVRLTSQQLLAGSFFRVERRGTGAGKLVLNSGQAEFTAANLHEENLVEVGDANVSDTDPLGGFLLQRGDFEIISADEQGGEDFGYGGPGLLAYLAREVLWSHTYFSRSIDASLPFDGQDPFGDEWRLSNAGTGSTLIAMAWRLLYEATHFRNVASYRHEHGDGVMHTDSHVDDKTSSVLPDLVVDFTRTLDSSGAAPTAYNGAFSARVKQSILSALLELVGKGMDVQMREGRQLKISAYNSYGRDLRGTAFAADVVRFAHGVNIANPARRAIEAALNGSRALVGSNDTYALVASPVGFNVGRSIGVDSDAEDASALAIDGATALRDREAASDVPALKALYGNDPLAGLYQFAPPEVGGHAWVGDLVTINRGAGAFQWDNADARIEAIQYDLTEDKVWDDPTVEFGAVYRSVEERGRAAAIQAIAAKPHGPHLDACRHWRAQLTLSYASGEGNDLSFGYFNADGDEVQLWRESVDGGPYPVEFELGGIGKEPVWYMRDHSCDGIWTPNDYGPVNPYGDLGPHVDHYRRVDNGDGTFNLEWNDGGDPVLGGCDTTDFSFTDLVVVLTPIATGDVHPPLAQDGGATPGYSARVRRCDGRNEHGYIVWRSTISTEPHHDARGIAVEAIDGLDADNAQDAFAELRASLGTDVAPLVHGHGAMVQGYTEIVGDGAATTFDITHNLNSLAPVVECWDLSGALPAQVMADVSVVDEDTVRIETAPTVVASDELRIVVHAAEVPADVGVESLWSGALV